MKLFLSFILCISASFSASAHKYYFGFAEVEYNDISQKFESTVILTAHDLERYIDNEKTISLESKLEELTPDSPDAKTVISVLNKTFIIKSGDHSSNWNLIGAEVKLDGSIHIYLESDPIELSESINILFSTLMSEFQEQQNKITLYYHNESHTVEFLQSAQNKTIKLENS